ncbi:MAG: hypothetical protein ABI462_11450, partial [Ignavibacteria bacterium]
QIPQYGNAVSIISGVIIIVLLVFITIKKYYAANPAMFGFILFLILTIFTSSLARVDVGFLSRYNIFATLLIICFSISIIGIYSQKINRSHILIFTLLSLGFNLYSFKYNIDDMKKMKEILTEGAVLANVGDYSLLVYPDSASVKTLVLAGIQNNIYKLPDFSLKTFAANDININSKTVTSDVSNTYNNFVNNDRYVYMNGWVNSDKKPIGKNSKIYAVFRSDKNLHVLNTTTMRRKELNEKNKQSITDNTSYSLALIKKDMGVAPGVYDLGFYIERGDGTYSYIYTDEEINF